MPGRNNIGRRIFLLGSSRRDQRMKALAWDGMNDIRCKTVPDPKMQDGGEPWAVF
jgi:hypothetical protein